MSFKVPEHFIKQYSANIMHLSQQKGSRLRNAVRVESHQGEEAFYDRIGQVVAQERVSRHSDTPRMDTPHDRRRATIKDFEYADLVDKQDKLRTLYDPANPYSVAAMYAMGRAMDDVIIRAALDVAYAGKAGTEQVILPDTQKIVANDGTTATGSKMNVNTLRGIKQIFDKNDVDESVMRYIAIGSKELQHLLEDTELTSSDFNTVKALVQGEIDTYMGFKFIRTERLSVTAGTTAFDRNTGALGGGDTLAAGARRCFAWAGDGLLLSIGKDIESRVSERADKSYATQVYSCMSIGATRMEEEKVVEVLVNEGA